jgi:hypothetical protein
MRPEDDIHKMIKKMHVKASTELDKKVHDGISISLAESACAKLSIKRSITKLAVAAAIFIAFGFGFSIGRWAQPPQSEPPSFDVTAYTSITQLYPTSPKTDDSFWRRKALAAMQPKPYGQIPTTKTSLLNVYKQYLKEKDYD